MNAGFVQTNYRADRIQEVVDYLSLVDQEFIGLTPYNVPAGPRGPGTTTNLVQPPTPVREIIQATVTLNSGTSLQLRRTPSVNGESLALIPNATQLEVLGQFTVEDPADLGTLTIPQWLFVTAEDPSTGAGLQGWVAAQFVVLTFRGRLFSLNDVPVLDGTQVGGPAVEGAASPAGAVAPGAASPAAPVAQPSVDPNQVQGRLLTSPGSELNLRDTPTTEGVVRIGLPAEAVLAVTGRNGAGTWLQVTYLNPTGSPVNGWVSAEFVSLSRNGNPVELGSLPITTGEGDSYVPPVQ
ncbi:MAG: SH3 domain-containing protein [Anaerolineae bacterium]|nr:SH3 domain-containing protein [Anaerolineae bacterium]